MRTLYEITDNITEIESALGDGESADESGEQLTEYLLAAFDAANEEFEAKVEDYGKVIMEYVKEAEGIKAELDRLTKKKGVIDNTVKRMKGRLQTAMEETGRTKIKTTLFNFRLQNNPPSVVLDKAIKDIPDEYKKFADPEIDKKKIAAAIKAGKEIDFAYLVQTRSLRIS